MAGRYRGVQGPGNPVVRPTAGGVRRRRTRRAPRPCRWTSCSEPKSSMPTARPVVSLPSRVRARDVLADRRGHRQPFVAHAARGATRRPRGTPRRTASGTRSGARAGRPVPDRARTLDVLRRLEVRPPRRPRRSADRRPRRRTPTGCRRPSPRRAGCRSAICTRPAGRSRRGSRRPYTRRPAATGAPRATAGATGRSTSENSSARSGTSVQVRPTRPRPSVWWPADTSVHSGRAVAGQGNRQRVRRPGNLLRTHGRPDRHRRQGSPQVVVGQHVVTEWRRTSMEGTIRE